MSSPVIVIEKSEDRKLGKPGSCSATYVSQASCPVSCVARNAWCYAETGHMAFHTRRVGASPILDPVELATIEGTFILESLSGKRPLRLHVVGDSTTDQGTSILARAAQVYSARHGMPVWTYTHAWREVARESWGQISILASCETPRQVAEARARGYATALVVPHHTSPKRYYASDVPVIPCPQQTGRAAGCSSCGLCFRSPDTLTASIGFAAHGPSKGKAILAIA